MTDNIQPSIDFCTETFTTIQNILTEYDWEQKAYPMPALIAMVGTQITTTPQRLKDLELLVRFFVHDHPDYFIGVGSKGGVQRVADRDAKVNREAAKAAAKKALQAKLNDATNTDNNPTQENSNQ